MFRDDLNKIFIEKLDNGLSMYKVENCAHTWFYTAEFNDSDFYSAEMDINAMSGTTYDEFKKFCLENFKG